MTLPTIDILICTIAERINTVSAKLLPPTDGIHYTVSYQTDGKDIATPKELLERQDVNVITLKGRGLSRNRNNAINHATGQLLVISDDDATYNLEQLRQIQLVASKNPQADVLTFMVATDDGGMLHAYPTETFLYPNRPKGFYYTSDEIVLRNGKNYPPFDVRFGLGSDRLHMGEEEVFIHDCHKQSLRIEFHPFVIQTVPSVTTSTHYASTPSLQESKGAVLTLLHGVPMALARIAYTAFRMRREISTLKHLTNMLKGMNYILTTKQHDGTASQTI
jgi:glycosyltransferase involved in cell wall biosynthesis